MVGRASLEGVGSAAASDSVGKENAASAAAKLRQQVVRRVLSSNVLSSVKAHLRAKLYTELKGSGSAHNPASWQPSAPRSPSLDQHVLNCLVCEFLLAQQYTYTLSVFLSETGSGSLPHLSRLDLLRLIGVLPESKVHTLLTGEGGNRDVGASAAGSPPSAHELPAAASLAERMVAALSLLGSRTSTRTATCQTTEDSGAAWDAGGTGSTAAPASSKALSERLAAIEEEYRRKSGALEGAAAASLEERMAAYQRECDARCAAQLEHRVASLRDEELAVVRQEEAARHSAALAAERASLAVAHQERLAALNKQEEELLERVRRMQREQDLVLEERMRRFKAEEERLHAWQAEAQAKVATREAAARQQVEAAEAAARAAEVAREEGKRNMSAKLEEVAAKEAQALHAKVAAEAEIRRVAALQQQLAGALQEQGGLGQQLSNMQAAHHAEVAALRLEADKLRHERDGLSAAVGAASTAAAAAPRGLSPSDSARLQQAVRRLMQRVEWLQGEVESGREREQVWRTSAAESEKLLGKSAKAHDGVLRHAEELRLALAAAAREVGDLQQQAALAAAGVDGPLAAALQAACTDARRWRESAEVRVSSAKEAEEMLRREGAHIQQCAVASRVAAAAGLQQVLGVAVRGRKQAAEFGFMPGGDSSSPEPCPVAQMAGAAAPASDAAPSAATQPPHTVPMQQPARTARAASPTPWPLPPQYQQAGELPPVPPAGGAGLLGSAAQQLQPAQQQKEQWMAHLEQATAPTVATTADGSKQPPSRTASDILAAYRARQQQRSGSGSFTGAVGPLLHGVSPSRGASGDEDAGGSNLQAAPGGGAPGGAAGTVGAPVPGGGHDSYYVSDLSTSEDSSRF